MNDDFERFFNSSNSFNAIAFFFPDFSLFYLNLILNSYKRLC